MNANVPTKVDKDIAKSHGGSRLAHFCKAKGLPGPKWVSV